MPENKTNSTSFFSKENLRFSISSLNYLPRWIILSIDFGVLIASCLFSFLLFRGTGLDFAARGYRNTSTQLGRAFRSSLDHKYP